MSLKEILKRVEESKDELSDLQKRIHIKLFNSFGDPCGDCYLSGKGEMKIEICGNKSLLNPQKVKEIIEKLSIYVNEFESDLDKQPHPSYFR